MRQIWDTEIHGVGVDEQTRCAHWHSDVDIIAIRFKCCGEWYPCYGCHQAVADHVSSVWPRNEFGEEAVLCGNCGHRLAIDEYLNCDSRCTKCDARFNPGCANHYDLYFETDSGAYPKR